MRQMNRFVSKGFTLIELMVVLAVMAMLATIVSPRMFGQLNRAKEETLQHNLLEVRRAIDKHFDDTGSYPASIEELVADRYLYKKPVDPMTGRSDSWKLSPGPDGNGFTDLHSGAVGNGIDGSPYSTW